MRREIEKVIVSIRYVGGYKGVGCEEEKFDNIQDAQSFLQTRKCWNREVIHQ